MAFKLEDMYSKDEILELYLNQIYFGAGAYGVETAAQTYFSKPASELTLSEGALLCGIVKSRPNMRRIAYGQRSGAAGSCAGTDAEK